MKTVQLAELADAAEEIRNGEKVLIRDGEKLIAEVTPLDAQRRQEEHVERLIREGKATRHGSGQLSDEFFTRPLAKAKASVLEALLEERRTGR
jgi:antitoxin (DNA-binding transcriptional repressor) of toxin-antitoxin stability system